MRDDDGNYYHGYKDPLLYIVYIGNDLLAIMFVDERTGEYDKKFVYVDSTNQLIEFKVGDDWIEYLEFIDLVADGLAKMSDR